MNATGTRRRRADGERSRNAILDTAAKLSTVEGLEGMSIGRLAEATGMSKSGLYAHFRSKEELQLATVETALRILTDEVVVPALGKPEGSSACSASATHSFRTSSGAYSRAAASSPRQRPSSACSRVAFANRSSLPTASG